MSWLPGPSASERRVSPAPRATSAVDRIVVKKAARRLYLMRGDQSVRAYPIALGFSPRGHKRREGDGRTPEGRYAIDWRNPKSRFHKSLHLSYPSPGDSRRAVFRRQAPGGMIMIHGQPNGRAEAEPLEGDWTLGCIAVSNSAIEEIWRLTPLGTPVEVLP
ncbi:L,D-transpeptidase family protein [Thiorhodococcus minor]|nr:L,D-transpeptidase family protein [Thiorhodococcus minor]